MNKLVFVTGTRADYGKIKSILQAIESSDEFQGFIYVTGMHLLKEHGSTYKQIEADGYKNVYIETQMNMTTKMDVNLANTIINFSKYISKIKPDFIVVHGDRIDALAAAIVGMLNNIRVIHIEGGELTGTVDDSIRHAITKMSHIHFVANEESKIRLQQLGESAKSISVIGSPDIDIMLSNTLPSLDEIKKEHNINFNKYSILMYHPVTTELNVIEDNINSVLKAIKISERNYIIIYPNNDHGSKVVIDAIEKLRGNENIIIVESFPFEQFLELLRNSDFIIGNSSAGIREACIYGIPNINIGTRQNKRFPSKAMKNIINVEENTEKIIQCINNIDDYRFKSYYFGNGNSTELFMEAMNSDRFVEQNIQKSFVDSDNTQQCIMNYINEVCF